MLNFHIRRRILIYSRSMTASSPSDVRCRERGIASPSQCESCTAIPYLRICAPSPGQLCTLDTTWTPLGTKDHQPTACPAYLPFMDSSPSLMYKL